MKAAPFPRPARRAQAEDPRPATNANSSGHERTETLWVAPVLGVEVTVPSDGNTRPASTSGEVSWLEADGSFVLTCGDEDGPEPDVVGFGPGTPWSPRGTGERLLS